MHNLCIFWFFCSKIIFDQKLFSYCWEKFDYPGSIVYLSCFSKNHFLLKIIFWLLQSIWLAGSIVYLSCYYCILHFIKIEDFWNHVLISYCWIFMVSPHLGNVLGPFLNLVFYHKIVHFDCKKQTTPSFDFRLDTLSEIFKTFFSNSHLSKSYWVKWFCKFFAISISELRWPSFCTCSSWKPSFSVKRNSWDLRFIVYYQIETFYHIEIIFSAIDNLRLKYCRQSSLDKRFFLFKTFKKLVYHVQM